MLLTITTTYQPATDLGFLLHKNPSRPQDHELWFGKVHIFYPEQTHERSTAAMVLDVNPVGLVREPTAGTAGRSDSPSDLKFAPFHIMATERLVHVDKNHVWHMERAHEIARAAGEMTVATTYKEVDLTERSSEDQAAEWWEELTQSGGEGMVVKPKDFCAKGRRGFLQPAIKCRGREYLRIIYGPEYTAPDNLERLRSRGLSVKRSLAMREFALGIEALERFVKKEPLRRVHECVFGVLALESEPVDPRL